MRYQGYRVSGPAEMDQRGHRSMRGCRVCGAREARQYAVLLRSYGAAALLHLLSEVLQERSVLLYQR